MGIKTRIEWCDSTVNPIMGCTGCALRKNHCYAATLCMRYAGCKGWPKSFDRPEFFPGRLEKAIKWNDLTGKDRPGKPWLNGLPRRIFVNDLSDGFCPDVDAYGWLLPHLDAMEDAPHIWLLLTKWPDRMGEFFASIGGAPDNFYLGVSVENQAAADERIPLLLQTPAAVHYVSVEPMLGPIDLSQHLSSSCLLTTVKHLQWIICGGESGPGARPMHPDWARSLRDQCQAAGVPFFFKQWGEFAPESHWKDFSMAQRNRKGAVFSFRDKRWPQNQRMYKVGKKTAGNLLDGRTWQEFPQHRP